MTPPSSPRAGRSTVSAAGERLSPEVAAESALHRIEELLTPLDSSAQGQRRWGDVNLALDIARSCRRLLLDEREAAAATPSLDRLIEILDDAEGDGIIGPDYTPPRLAEYILARLDEGSATPEQED